MDRPRISIAYLEARARFLQAEREKTLSPEEIEYRRKLEEANQKIFESAVMWNEPIVLTDK